jgi:transcriptional regulator with XRE-family HTH domain
MSLMPEPTQRQIPRWKTSPAVGKTLLAHWRIKRGMTQAKVAKLAGIPIATYRRLERGKITNPRVGWINNCAFVLQIDPAVLLRDYADWVALPGGPKRPPMSPEANHRDGWFGKVPEPAILRRERRMAANSWSQ